MQDTAAYQRAAKGGSGDWSGLLNTWACLMSGR